MNIEGHLSSRCYGKRLSPYCQINICGSLSFIIGNVVNITMISEPYLKKKYIHLDLYLKKVGFESGLNKQILNPSKIKVFFRHYLL